MKISMASSSSLTTPPPNCSHSRCASFWTPCTSTPAALPASPSEPPSRSHHEAHENHLERTAPAVPQDHRQVQGRRRYHQAPRLLAGQQSNESLGASEFVQR